MADPAFPKLPREDKDLLYSQQRVMSEYVQIITQNFMSQKNEIESKKSNPTTDFLPSDGAPCSLFHVTSGRKAKLYRQTGRINAPVRGFDTLMAAMAWAMKTGRKVIMQVEPVSIPQMLPDHHNDFGRAWWTESIPMGRVKCAYSAEGAWPHPDSSANAESIHYEGEKNL